MSTNRQIYCGRERRAVIKGKKFPLPTVTETLEKQLTRKVNKMEARRDRRTRKLLGV